MSALIQAALRAADPVESIRRHLRRIGDVLWAGERAYDLRDWDEVRLIAVGKAAVPMARRRLACSPIGSRASSW